MTGKKLEQKQQEELKKQLLDIERNRKLETRQIPDNFDFINCAGLSLEARQRLDKAKPRTLGQASRMQGITPADINVLIIMLKKHK